MTRRLRRLLLLLLVVPAGLAVLLAVDGCHARYILGQAVGQARVLWSSRAIEEVLADPEVPEAVKAKIRIVQEGRRFATEELRLVQTDNYTTYYDTGDQPIAWNLSACPELSLQPYTWTFPIVGTMPYIGYFDREDALEAEEELEEEGYDTWLRSVAAYSTLGWFTDPIFSSFLRYSEPTLVNLIIHETIHATCFIEGEVAFNETLASFLGDRGTLLYLEQRHGRDSEIYARTAGAYRDDETFARFIDTFRERLRTLYASDLPEEALRAGKRQAFEDARAAYRELRETTLETGRYDRFLDLEPNNARIRAFGTYHERLPLFHRMWELMEGDFEAMMRFFLDVEERGEDPYQAMEAWIDAASAPSPSADGGADGPSGSR